MADNVEEIKNENEKNSKAQVGIGTIIVIIVMIAVAVAIYNNFIKDKRYNSYESVMSISREDDGSTEYMSYGDDGVLKYGRDGAATINSSGDIIWSVSYEMKNPKAYTCGGYVAVADIGNKVLVIINENGKMENVEILSPILQAGVSSHGIVAVMLEDDNSNIIQICDAGTVYTKIKTRVKEDGYPLAMAYSPDGKKLITSYLHVTGDETENMVTFYNFSEVGQNYDSDIVMANNYEKNIVPRIAFLNDTTVGVFADNRFQIYEMKEIPSQIYESDEYAGEVKSIAYNSEYIALIMENEDNEKNVLHIYSVKGKEMGKCSLDMDYEDVVVSNEDVILYSRREMEIITKNGNVKYHEESDKGISKILTAKEKNRYFMIDDDNINLIKMKNN